MEKSRWHMALERLQQVIQGDDGIPPSQRLGLIAVMAVIEQHSDDDGACRLIARQIAAMVNRDEGSISKLLKVLEEKHFIGRRREGFPAETIIRII